MNRKPNADNIVQWNAIIQIYMETLQIIVIAINRNFY